MRAYQEYSEKIREAGRRLLSEKKVDAVIGFRKGSVPFMNEPVWIKQADQTHQLYWDGNCGVNLANYLPRRPERMAIVAKGCDSRNIVVHILENQIQRDQLYILGAPCHGMLDRKRILAELNGKEPNHFEENDQNILVSGNGFETTLHRGDFLQRNGIVAKHTYNLAQLAEILHEVVGERVIVIDHQQHGFFYPFDSFA